MEYFNDMTFVDISSKTVRSNNPMVKGGPGCIGIMCGGPAIFCLNGTTRLLECPFLYWNHTDSPDYRAWRTPRGAVRHNSWVSASGERMERMVSALDAFSEDSYIHLEDPALLLKVFDRLKKCFDSHELEKQTSLVLLMEELMSAIRKTVLPDVVSERVAGEVAALCRQMSLAPEKEYDFADLAKEMNLSEIYFRRCFTKYAGSSPYSFLLSKRYLLAVKLLRESPLQIQEIAQECGFAELRGFSTFFRKRSGISPSRFRKMFL